MILTFILGVASCVWKIFFALISMLPDVPAFMIDKIDWGLKEVFNYTSLCGLFIDVGYIKKMIPVALIVFNVDKIYRFTMFILHKIPFININ